MRMESKVEVFKVKDKRQGISDLKEFNKTIDKSKVYGQNVFSELFGEKRVYKSAICKDIEVRNGAVDTEIELYADETVKAVDEELYPFMHVGCIALGFMGLDRRMKGSFTVVVRDGRKKKGSDEICAFRFICKDKVAAFVDFPDFCVATADLKQGFTLKLSITSEGLEFLDETHPLALNLVSICRFMDDTMETKMLVKKHGKHMYQELCETEILHPSIGKLQETKVEPQTDNDTMRAVQETIKILNGRKKDKSGHTDPAERQSSWGQI
ncbi:movement protein [Agave yellow streak virus Jalisco 1]|uniref:Movement protein n=1 Tax=Agave yellow streak virus Jalisco 1 TaxID=3142681 RepID=A0A1X9ZMU5_9VIRU|nr:movement protein [Agave tequilana leaf virus]ARS73023.1 movement protein [Agave tequilana leaf virus]